MINPRYSIPIFIILLIGTFIYSRYIPLSAVTGIYLSNNSAPLADGPGFGDTLELLDDNSFRSDTWGSGTFNLRHAIGGTSLELRYKYEYGSAGYITQFYRPFFYGKPRISIFRDANSYFEKIK